ncbi:MAG: hypothetical protein KDK51_02425 [Deltaproteobacteria bacterium]|nr:hypothetical protein [Deltaproteobacteria bacterium]
MHHTLKTIATDGRQELARAHAPAQQFLRKGLNLSKFTLLKEGKRAFPFYGSP